MKNLILLEQDYKEVEQDIIDLNKKIIELEPKLGLSSTTFEEMISSTTKTNTSDILLEKYISLKIKYNLKLQKKEKILNQINFYYELYKKSQNEDEMIYIEKKIKKYSNAKISVLHGGMGNSTIYFKLEEVTKKYEELLQKELQEQQLIKNATSQVLKELRTK